MNDRIGRICFCNVNAEIDKIMILARRFKEKQIQLGTKWENEAYINQIVMFELLKNQSKDFTAMMSVHGKLCDSYMGLLNFFKSYHISRINLNVTPDMAADYDRLMPYRTRDTAATKVSMSYNQDTAPMIDQTIIQSGPWADRVEFSQSIDSWRGFEPDFTTTKTSRNFLKRNKTITTKFSNWRADDINPGNIKNALDLLDYKLPTGAKINIDIDSGVMTEYKTDSIKVEAILETIDKWQRDWTQKIK